MGAVTERKEWSMFRDFLTKERVLKPAVVPSMLMAMALGNFGGSC
jgi:hypothetical protein